MPVRGFAKGLFAATAANLTALFPASPQTALQLMAWYRKATGQAMVGQILTYFGANGAGSPQNALALIPDDILAAQAATPALFPTTMTAQDVINACVIADALGQINIVSTAN